MATEAPVLLVVEVEPTETASFAVGSSYRTHLQIVDADSKQPVDPDTNFPTLTVTPPFTSPTVYQYGVGSEIVRLDVGLFYADVPITKSGKNLHRWLATLGGISVGSNTTELQGVLAGWW